MKNVLFLCVENSCRSQMAEAFARIHGAAVVNAYSSGSQPSGTVNTMAIESMREIGYPLDSHRSKSVSQIPPLEYDLVVTMGCGDACPAIQATAREDWEIPDPKEMNSADFRKIRDLIEVKVKELVRRYETTGRA